MKKIYLSLIAIAFAINFAYAQNTFPSSGSVGIGATSPEFNLDIKGSTTNELRLIDIGDVGMQFTANNSTNVFSLRNSGSTMYLSTENSYGLFIGTNASSLSVPAFAGTSGMYINASGNIGIGTTDTKGYLFAVNGSAIATSMTVKLYADWPDYVFKPAYHLPTLTEIKAYIDQNHHLPEMPSAEQVEKDGLSLGEMNAKLLKKVEELTLYLITQHEQIVDQQKVSQADKVQLRSQQEQINALQQQLDILIKTLTKK